MNRRQFIAGFGGVGLAGCMGGNDTPTEGAVSPTPTPTPAPTPIVEQSTSPTDETVTARSGWFELVGVDAPREVELGESYTLTFSVRNTSERTRTFSTRLGVRFPGSEEQVDPDPWQAVVVPGATATLESRPFTGRRLGTVHHRLVAFEHRVGVRVVARRLPFGAGYTTSTGVLLAVLRIRFRQSFEYVVNDYVYEEPSPPGETWAFVTVYAKNTASSAELLPFKVNFSLSDGDSRYSYARTNSPEGQYNGGRVRPGTVREGWVLFAVPTSVEMRDLSVTWTDNTYDATRAVRWVA